MLNFTTVDSAAPTHSYMYVPSLLDGNFAYSSGTTVKVCIFAGIAARTSSAFGGLRGYIPLAAHDSRYRLAFVEEDLLMFFSDVLGDSDGLYWVF